MRKRSLMRGLVLMILTLSLRAADLIIVPKSQILLFDNFADLVFTRGIYRIFPFSTTLSFTNLTTLIP